MRKIISKDFEFPELPEMEGRGIRGYRGDNRMILLSSCINWLLAT